MRCASFGSRRSAVAMSMRRYTSAESTLTISTGKCRASSSATPVLPLAVGPINRIAGGNSVEVRVKADYPKRRVYSAHAARPSALSFPSHEHLVQLAYRDLEPGRPPVVALAGALGRFHVAQQRVHLGHREGTVGPDRSVAGHGGEHFVLALCEHPAAAELRDFRQPVPAEFTRVGLGNRHCH